MTITDTDLDDVREHLGGEQRFYKFSNGFGLSLINAPMVHAYPFAWEAAVLDDKGKITYAYPGLSSDVEVFDTDDEANAFIAKAKAHFETP